MKHKVHAIKNGHIVYDIFDDLDNLIVGGVTKPYSGTAENIYSAVQDFLNMDHKKLKKMLIEHEGIKYAPYTCTAGKTTIGIGHNLDDKGISKAVVDLLYNEDVAEVEADLKAIFDDFDTLPDQIQLVLADMRFQLGYRGFRSFKRMINAVKNRNWPTMFIQMKNSNWHSQTPKRSNDLMRMVIDVT